MLNIVNPAVKFSYSVNKGSIKSRQALVSKYNEQIFEKVYNKMDDGQIHINDLNNAIKEVLPEKKRIDIMTFNDSGQSEGASDYIYNKRGKIIGQTLEMPMKRNKMEKRTIVTFMHELTHVLDTLTNPKYTSRTNKMLKKDMFSDEYNALAQDKIYNWEKFKTESEKKKILDTRKRDIEKFLRGKTAEDRIDYIQDLRIMLTTEKLAYAEQLKFANKLKERGCDVSKSDLSDSKKFLFDEKLQILNELGMDIISMERRLNASKLSSNHH